MGFNATLTAKVISWWSVTHYVFPGFLTPVLEQLFFPKPPTTFLTCFCRGERQKYAGKKSRLNRGSNSQPPGHESITLTTEPPGRGKNRRSNLWLSQYSMSRIDGRLCDRIHCSLLAVHCFNDGYMGRQLVAWKQYCAEYW